MVWQAHGVRELVTEQSDAVNLVDAILGICRGTIQLFATYAVLIVAVESGGSRFRPETVVVIARDTL